MERREKLKILEDWQVLMLDSVEVRDSLTAIIGWDENGKIFRLLERMKELASKSVVMTGTASEDWLDWYAYENDYGKKGNAAGIAGNLTPVKSVGDLLDVIERVGK